MTQVYVGLNLVFISLVVLCGSQRYARCPPEDVLDLVYGQSFYELSDSTGGNPTLALRNDTRHKIHPVYVGNLGTDNITFIILVPNIFRGVEMRRITMLTRNVKQVVMEVTKESEIEVNGNGELEVYGGGVGELVDDIVPMNKFQRTTFEVPGDIARVELNFLRGAKGRVRIQKLYIHACKGKVQSSGGL